MNLIEIMYPMHVRSSSTDNPPFKHTREFDKNNVNWQLLQLLKDEYVATKFSVECLNELNTLLHKNESICSFHLVNGSL